MQPRCALSATSCASVRGTMLAPYPGCSVRLGPLSRRLCVQSTCVLVTAMNASRSPSATQLSSVDLGTPFAPRQPPDAPHVPRWRPPRPPLSLASYSLLCRSDPRRAEPLRSGSRWKRTLRSAGEPPSVRACQTILSRWRALGDVALSSVIIASLRPSYPCGRSLLCPPSCSRGLAMVSTDIVF